MGTNSEFYDYDAVPTQKGNKVLKNLNQRNPDNVYAAVSGGNDSITALHFAHQSPQIELNGVLHVDTGFGIPQTAEYVKERCEDYGLEFIRIGDHNARFSDERFESLAKLFGFPGSSIIAHSQVRHNLKDKPFDRFETNLDGDLALISGVRRFESDRRYEKLDRDGIQEVNGITWASPLVDFTDKDISTYQEHHQITENPVSALLCTSGECMCGSFGDRENLPLLEEYFPEFARKLFQLEWSVLERAARGEIKQQYSLWAHGSVAKGEYEARTDVDQASLMCSDCEERCPNKPYQMTGNPLSPAEKYMKENDLSDLHQWPFYCAPCDQVVNDPLSHRQEVHPFDEDSGLAGEWDMRRIELDASHESGEIITEPNGWNVDASQITKDEDAAKRSKHRYYYQDIALYHCNNHDHSWEEYNGGPVKRCTDCFAFNLNEYDAENPGPPTVGVDTENKKELTPDQQEATHINQQLSDFRTAEKYMG
jgi:phosphoadenosine phosphosulfate reductase